jgi:transposase InsO family protein
LKHPGEARRAGRRAGIDAPYPWRSRGTYGSPRIAVELREQGLNIGRRRVTRLMSENVLSGVPKRRFRGSTTGSAHTNPVALNFLDRQFTVAKPNEVWVGDITYLPVNGGWVYLAVLIDLYIARRPAESRWLVHGRQYGHTALYQGFAAGCQHTKGRSRNDTPHRSGVPIHEQGLYRR